MFRQMLYAQWKAARLWMLPLALAAFTAPLLSVRGLGGLSPGQSAPDAAWALIRAHILWMPLFPILAFAVGMAAALAAWSWDHQGEHVYALSLPVPRWEYALLKMGAGAVVMGVCVVAFGLGALVATGALHLPETLHPYPWRASLRFLLAATTAYAVIFAFAAGSVRTTVLLLAALVGVLLLGQLVTTFLGALFPAMGGRDLAALLFQMIKHSPGPLHVFTGNWMLIDG